MARAADSTPCNVGSVIVLLVGSTSTATWAAAGSNWRNRASRFATNSVAKIFTPVRLPSGRARLATRPTLTGLSADTKRTGIVLVASLAANAALSPTATIAALRNLLRHRLLGLLPDQLRVAVPLPPAPQLLRR